MAGRKAEDIIQSYDDGGTTTTAAPEKKQSAEDIIKRYDEADAATTATTPDDPYSLNKAWIQIPALHSFAAGVTQGARNVLKTGVDFAAWADRNVPALAWIDRHTIGDLTPTQNALAADKRRFEESPEGRSLAGKAGQLYGEIGATLPGVGPAASTAGATVSALTKGAPRVISWLGRTVAEGAAGGATYGAMTEQPVGENALYGAVLAPPASMVAKGVGLGAQGAKSAYNWLRGTGPAQEIDATIAAAKARAGGGGGPPDGGGTGGPPGGGGGGATVPPAPAADLGIQIAQAQADIAATAVNTPERAAARQRLESLVAQRDAAMVPQSGGAAATPPDAIPAPDRARGIAGKVDALDQMSSQQSNLGRGDFTEYVKGNKPTLAEGLGDAELATIQRQLEEDQRFVNRRRTMNENRQDHFDNRAGTAEQLDTLERDIAAWDKETLGPVWANKKPVDATELETLIKTRLASPEAQVGPVEQALREVEQRLYNRTTGELHTDPQMLYGARRHISHLLSRAGQKANPAYADDAVMSELIAMRDAIDRTIEPGAAGFKAWVTEHAAKMRDVDRMTLLQGMRQKLIGANGEMQGSRMLTQLKALRNMMARGGANPAHSLNIEDLEMLRDLYKDLLRDANRTLALPVGSNTRQNLNTAATHGFDVFNMLAQRGASAVPLGGEALAAFTRQTNARNAAVAKEYWIKRLLEPPPGGGP